MSNRASASREQELQTPSAPAADAASTVLQGSVRSGTGLPVAGADVRVSGPSASSTTTDAAGAFSLTVPQGIYTISVRRAGYNPAVLSNIVAVAARPSPFRSRSTC